MKLNLVCLIAISICFYYVTAQEVGEGTILFFLYFIGFFFIACDFEGIKCMNETGFIIENACSPYYTQCDNGEYTEPREVAPGTQCYNGVLVLNENCGLEPDGEPITRENCTFTGIRCITEDGKLTNTVCTYKYVQCEYERLTQSMPVAPGTVCYNGHMVYANECESIDIPEDSKTTGKVRIYMQCEFGYLTQPRPVANGTACYNGYQIFADSCEYTIIDPKTGLPYIPSYLPPTPCNFTGFECFNSENEIVTDECTDRFVQCYDFYQTIPLPVAPGTLCYNSMIIHDYECGNPTDAPTDAPTETPVTCDFEEATACFDGIIVVGTTCGQVFPNITCDFEGLQCSDALGNIATEFCTGYFVQCYNGLLTIPQPTPSNEQCFNGELVASSRCTTGDLNPCNTANPNYPRCLEPTIPTVTEPETEDTTLNINACNFEGMECVDKIGFTVADQCTQYYHTCENGITSVPIKTAPGTRCYMSTIVNMNTCPAKKIEETIKEYQCFFNGIQCINDQEEFVKDQCTDKFLICENSYLSMAFTTSLGTSCLNNNIIHSNECPSTNKRRLQTSIECSFKEPVCVNEDSTIITTTCTDYYALCDEGYQTSPLPIPAGTACYQGQLVQRSICTDLPTEIPTEKPVECSFTGIRCYNEEGIYTATECTSYFKECEDGGILSPSLPVALGTACFNDIIVDYAVCTNPPAPECDFTGILCVNENTVEVKNNCTQYYIECDNGYKTEKRPVSEGTTCFNSVLKNKDYCEVNRICSFSGLRCITDDGLYVIDQCTDKYIMCENGIETIPYPTNEGTKCYNGNIIDSTQCDEPCNRTCSFTGIKCVNNVNEIQIDTCTNYYTQCIDGYQSLPQPVATGTQCYNGEQILIENCPYIPPNVECTFEGIECVNDNNVYVTDECTNYFVECDNGYWSSRMPVAKGTQCRNNEIVDFQICNVKPINIEGNTCNFEDIVCVSEDRQVIYDTCTTQFVQCTNGYISVNRPVAPGTYCLNGTLVLPSLCNGGTVDKCDFFGIRCTNQYGYLYTDICTSNFVYCDNGDYTVPMIVPEGTYCYDNTLILKSACTDVVPDDDKSCMFDGILCTSEEGKVMNKECTSYYIECVDMIITNITNVPEDKTCLNGHLVNPSSCPLLDVPLDTAPTTDATEDTTTASIFSEQQNTIPNYQQEKGRGIRGKKEIQKERRRRAQDYTHMRGEKGMNYEYEITNEQMKWVLMNKVITKVDLIQNKIIIEWNTDPYASILLGDVYKIDILSSPEGYVASFTCDDSCGTSVEFDIDESIKGEYSFYLKIYIQYKKTQDFFFSSYSNTIKIE
ncbi:hypothetical protein WA158_005596 [Blastocystis sp. Blastoise]